MLILIFVLYGCLFVRVCSLHLTTFAVQYPPTRIAAVCLMLAGKWMKYEARRTSRTGIANGSSSISGAGRSARPRFSSVWFSSRCAHSHVCSLMPFKFTSSRESIPWYYLVDKKLNERDILGARADLSREIGQQSLDVDTSCYISIFCFEVWDSDWLCCILYRARVRNGGHLHEILGQIARQADPHRMLMTLSAFSIFV